MRAVLLGLGANIPGRWGPPGATLARTVRELTQAGVKVLRVSDIYSTVPQGTGPQPCFLNAVALVAAPLSSAMLLRLLKRIERQAGRGMGRRWGPRPLDIDILDHGGRRIGWPPRQRAPGPLVLPHPEMHRRAFVLVPLLQVAPRWRHPVLGLGARTLLARLRPVEAADVLQSLDFVRPACEESSRASFSSGG